jgi:hypothetical protein
MDAIDFNYKETLTRYQEVLRNGENDIVDSDKHLVEIQDAIYIMGAGYFNDADQPY